MNNINNDDWEQKKQGFTEVLKLMEMINEKRRSPLNDIARMLKDQLDAFMDAGFTRQEAFELVKQLLSGIGRS